MPIVADAVTEALGMAGMESVDHGGPDLTLRLIGDFNRALNELSDANPQAFFFERPDESELVRQPKTVYVNVTNQAKTINAFGGYASARMPGCVIFIDGDPRPNRLLNEATGITPTLQAPYMGATGTNVRAVVYHDWIKLNAAVREVTAPIMMDRDRLMTRAPTLTDLRSSNPQLGTPCLFFPQSFKIQQSLRAGLMLDKLPTADGVISFTARMKYDPVTSLDDARAELTPWGKDAEIFMPIFRWFFASYPGCTVTQNSLVDEKNAAVINARGMRVRGPQTKKFIYNPRW